MCSIEEYFEKPYWVIDILPKQVPDYQQQGECKGQYFRIADYYLMHPRIDSVYGKFTNILLKLNCYEDFSVSQDGEDWMKNPAPEALETMMSRCPYEKGMLYIMLESEETLVTVSGDDTYMTVYHPSEKVLDLLASLVASEGLFIWNPSH